MSTDPMIGGKTREQWSAEEAPLLAGAKRRATRATYKSLAAASAVLVAFAWFGQHYRHTHYFHEVLVYVLLAWFGHGMYIYGRSSSKP